MLKIEDNFISSSLKNSFFKTLRNKIDYAILSAMPEELELFSDKFSNLSYSGFRVGEFDFKIYDYQ